MRQPSWLWMQPPSLGHASEQSYSLSGPPRGRSLLHIHSSLAGLIGTLVTGDSIADSLI